MLRKRHIAADRRLGVSMDVRGEACGRMLLRLRSHGLRTQRRLLSLRRWGRRRLLRSRRRVKVWHSRRLIGLPPPLLLLRLLRSLLPGRCWLTRRLSGQARLTARRLGTLPLRLWLPLGCRCPPLGARCGSLCPAALR